MGVLRVWGADAGDFHNGKLIRSALTAFQALPRGHPDSVDLSGLTMIRPYTLAALAAIGVSGGCRASLVLPRTHEARDYVLRSGLLKFFRSGGEGPLPPSRRTVPVRRLETPSQEFADEVTTAWEQEFGGMPPALRPRLADHLDEIIRNALSHAESPIGCIVAANVYPGLRTAELCVLDLGQTIRAHLARNPRYSYLSSDREAILKATEEGVTGTPPGSLNALGEPNSGVGLFDLREYCERGGGDLSICSGESIVHFRPPCKCSS
jgi:hypothetical protein